MANSKLEEIDRLLREGLDHYGYDDVAAAILVWKGVLALDPGNVEAADYIKTADRRKHPRPEKTTKTEAAQAVLEIGESRAASPENHILHLRLVRRANAGVPHVAG